MSHFIALHYRYEVTAITDYHLPCNAMRSHNGNKPLGFLNQFEVRSPQQ